MIQPDRSPSPGGCRGWREFFLCIDLRSLGLFRITLGLVLLAHGCLRWTWLDLLYTDRGAFPGTTAAKLALQAGYYEYFLSPLAWFDAPWAVRLYLLATLLCYAALVVGYRTRWAALLSWLAFVTWAHRNPLVLIGADFVLASMLLWAQFLPLGERFSWDAVRRALRGGVPLRDSPRDDGEPAVPAPRRMAPRLAALGIVLQIALIYLLTAVWKSGPTWIPDATAVYYVLHVEQYVLAPGVWLRSAPLGVLQGLTWGTLVVEYLAAPMILSPWGQPHLRRILLLLLVALHVGIAATIDAGLFSYAMLATFPLLLLPRDWELLRRLLRRWSRPATAYYDDSCGICTRTCEILAALDRFGRLSFIGSSQIGQWRHDIPPGLTERTIVVLDDRTGRMTTHSRAVARLLRALPCPWALLGVMALPGVRWLADGAYNMVARNRHRLSAWLGMAACRVAASAAAAPAMGQPAGPDAHGPQRDMVASAVPSRPNSTAVPADAAALPTAGHEQPGATADHGAEAGGRMAARGGLPRGCRRGRANDVAAGVVLVALLVSAACELALLDARLPLQWRGFLVYRVAPWNFVVRGTLALQRWNMFSPDAPQIDQWFVASARLRDGREVDLFTHRPASLEQPSWREHRFPSTLSVYLKHAFAAPASPRAVPLAQALCRWLSRGWSAKHTGGSDALREVRLFWLRRSIPDPDRRSLVALDTIVLGTYVPADDGFQPGPTRFHRVESYASGVRRGAGLMDLQTQRREGEWTFWREDGSLDEQGPFVEGLPHGQWISWDPGGWKHSAGPFVRGHKTGVWTRYYPPPAGQSFQPRQAQATLLEGAAIGPAEYWYPWERSPPGWARQDGPRWKRGVHRDDLLLAEALLGPLRDPQPLAAVHIAHLLGRRTAYGPLEHFRWQFWDPHGRPLPDVVYWHGLPQAAAPAPGDP